MIDTGASGEMSERTVVGGGRGGNIRGAINRSFAVSVMGLGVEGRLGGAPRLVRFREIVECGGATGSISMGAGISRGDVIGWSEGAEVTSETRSAQGATVGLGEEAEGALGGSVGAGRAESACTNGGAGVTGVSGTVEGAKAEDSREVAGGGSPV